MDIRTEVEGQDDLDAVMHEEYKQCEQCKRWRPNNQIDAYYDAKDNFRMSLCADIFECKTYQDNNPSK